MRKITTTLRSLRFTPAAIALVTFLAFYLIVTGLQALAQ